MKRMRMRMREKEIEKINGTLVLPESCQKETGCLLRKEQKGKVKNILSTDKAGPEYKKPTSWAAQTHVCVLMRLEGDQ
jgi:hypothetical protein